MPSSVKYQFADLMLDTGQRRLTRGGEPIELPKLTYALLVALVDAAPDVLTHDDLVRRVWNGRVTSPETVTQRVKLLRVALADDAERPRYIGLVRGHGYRLLPTVERVPADVPPITAPSMVTARTANAPPTRWPARAVAVGAAAVLIVAASLLVLGNYASDRTAVTPQSNLVAGQPAAREQWPSVAVLPFVNDSPDPDQQYFADGLSAELINALSRIPGLAVPGRASSFYFRGKDESIEAIGTALNVDHVLTGSVQRSEDRLRITAELIDANTGLRRWGDTYERTLEDIFAIQDDITTHVAAALEITLGVGRLGRIPGAPRNVNAYAELVKGNGYFAESRGESFQRAIDQYLRATQLDESSSVAWISLANAYAAAIGYQPARASELWRRANEAADKARALTPEAMHVLQWDAQRSIDRGDWSEAARFFEQLNEERFPLSGQEYGPNAGLWLLKGFFLLQVGRVREAAAQLEQARAADPLFALTARLLGDAYADAGALSAALAEMDRGMQLGSDVPALQGYSLAVALGSGNREEIRRRLDALWPSPATDAHLRMARFLNEPAAAVVELREFAAAPPAAPDFLASLVMAHWAGYYGDASTALALLQRIPRNVFTADVALAIWRPVFSDMRKLPEFKQFVQERGLVDYWREHGWPDFCQPNGESFACE